MDDLISRKEAMDCCLKPQVRPNEEIFNALKMAIRGEALAPLCEWLARATQPCILLAIGCPYDDSNCEDCDSCEAWKEALTKWMEEQDAAD